MDDEQIVRISKYLSRHLRHSPGRLGLSLDSAGWVGVDELLHACASHGVPISRAELNEVVALNDKRRYSFDETGTRIRANQGHTVEVNLQLAPAEPPCVLYHGTALRSLESILAAGLFKMARHHVHLSADIETARKVGSRRGRAAILEVAAGAMSAAGSVFYRSDNGVWLVAHVPPGYLRRLE